MAGYQKPNRGTLEEGRGGLSSEGSMAQDIGIGFSGQGTCVKKLTDCLDGDGWLCYKSSQQFSRSHDLPAGAVREVRHLTGRFCFCSIVRLRGIFVL